MKKFLLTSLAAGLLFFTASSLAVAPLILGMFVPAAQYWAASIGAHVGALMLAFERKESQPSAPIGLAFATAMMAQSKPMIVHIEKNEPLKTPAGWTPATGTPVTQSGKTYAANQPVPPSNQAVITIPNGIWNFVIYASFGANFTSSNSACQAAVDYYSRGGSSATAIFVDAAIPYCQVAPLNGVSFQAQLTNSSGTCSSGSVAANGTCVSCPTGTSLNPDGVTCSPPKPADGTAEYYVDDAGNFLRDAEDPDTPLATPSFSDRNITITNPDGSYSRIQVLTVENGRVKEAVIDEVNFDGRGVLKVSRTLWVGPCVITPPDWELCIERTQDFLENPTSGASSRTNITADVVGNKQESIVEVGDQTTLTYIPIGMPGPGSASGVEDMGNCPGCARETTLRGVDGTLKGMDTKLQGIDNSLKDVNLYTQIQNGIIGYLAGLLSDIKGFFTGTSPEPADPEAKTGADIQTGLDPLGTALSPLSGWQLPAHNSACPTGQFSTPFSPVPITWDQHCQFAADNLPFLSTIFMVIWNLAAIAIILGA